MTTDQIKEIQLEHIGSSKTLHELACGLAYYNHEGNHFRVFESFEDAKAFLLGEQAKIIAEFDLEEDLDQFLEDTEICSVCGAICKVNEDCYLESENDSMKHFLGKPLGLSQESVSLIANGSTALYCVHVVCDNELQHYSLYGKKEEAIASYVKLCKEWYTCEGLAAFSETDEYDSEVQYFDAYYNSYEYNFACDNAKVTWEVLNA